MKWILLVLLVGGGAFAYWSYTQAHPEVKACARFAELCGADTRGKCDEAYQGLAKAATPEQLAPSVKCMAEATTCTQASGCLAGAAAKAGLNAAGEFLKGFGEALGK